jgi:hypothetical protein
MTEAQWPLSENPSRMLASLFSRGGKGAGTDERFRRFGIACCRRVAEVLEYGDTYALDCLEAYMTSGLREALLKARRFRRGAADNASRALAVVVRDYSPKYHRIHATATASSAVWNCTKGNPRQAAMAYKEAAIAAAYLLAAKGGPVQHRGVSRFEPDADELGAQAALVRCIFGNPFRPVAFDPAWRTDTAVVLARQMYDSRDFGAMPILADALQDAGCEDEQVLNHCREPGPHARGCWVCDAVLL